MCLSFWSPFPGGGGGGWWDGERPCVAHNVIQYHYPADLHLSLSARDVDNIDGHLI